MTCAERSYGERSMFCTNTFSNRRNDKKMVDTNMRETSELPDARS